MSELWSGDFGKPMSMGGGLGALIFFWQLEKGTIAFNFRSNEPSHVILGSLGQYNHPSEKTKYIKKKKFSFLDRG